MLLRLEGFRRKGFSISPIAGIAAGVPGVSSDSVEENQVVNMDVEEIKKPATTTTVIAKNVIDAMDAVNTGNRDHTPLQNDFSPRRNQVSFVRLTVHPDGVMLL
jgi:hypothetical protein